MYTLGARLRQLRAERSMTLNEVSKLCDVAVSTLSKIENDQVSPVYGTLRKIAVGLGVAFESLVSDKERETSGARRAVTRRGDAAEVTNDRYVYSMHASDLISKAMLPVVMTIQSRTQPHANDWSSHEGEEFILVLEGAVDVYLEHYQPVRLEVGESLYIDSRMGHGFVSVGPGDARLICVSYDPKQLNGAERAAAQLSRRPIGESPRVQAKHAPARNGVGHARLTGSSDS
ncbi:helix-turn-helix domain-containing protein [Roseixanthobacter pseudopolyaromaticivorans]|uniref:helix-turn-helix domain-containing protein n=1 Tax=Xanthobacteraceae TaxID=335928 RepID=UPI003727FB16